LYLLCNFYVFLILWLLMQTNILKIALKQDKNLIVLANDYLSKLVLSIFFVIFYIINVCVEFCWLKNNFKDNKNNYPFSARYK
jgi:hypothetical protein